MTVRRYGTLFILLHGTISLVHEISHRIIPVHLPTLQYVIAYLFVGVLPLVALAMLWTPRSRGGLWLLFVSMAGSLVYAGTLHFVILHNPDHVSQIIESGWRPVFWSTAGLMAATEAFGCWLSVWLLRRSND